MRDRRLVPRLLGLAMTVLAVSATAADKVAVFGDALARSAPFLRELQAAGFEAQAINGTELSHIDASDARLVVVGPDVACPPESRPAIARFMASRRHVVVVGAGAFDYTPQPVRGLLAVDLGDARAYEVRQPKARGPNERYPVEPTRVSADVTPDGRAALSFRTYLRGMNDTWLKFSPTAARGASRGVLTFWAKGDAYADLVAIDVVDTRGRHWIGYVPVGGDWRRHLFALADLLPRGWKKPDEVPPLIDPAEIAIISMGIDAATIWREKPMTFSLGGIELAEDALERYAPTSGITALRLPFQQSATTVPNWLFNPFQGARSLATGGLVRSATDGASSLAVVTRWECPTPLVLHPGVQMGTDHKKELDTKAEREQRRIPLWQTEEGEVVAEQRLLAGGNSLGASLALFGLSAAEVAREPALRASVVASVTSMLQQPRIAEATINTTAASSGAVVPVVRVRVHNPRGQNVAGRVAIDVAQGRLRGTVPIALPARGEATVTVPLPAVPADFTFDRFDWQVTLEAGEAGRDEFGTTVDAERSLLRALAHLVRTQRQFPDGRISHHYFGDAYGVRALFAYLDLLTRQPERAQRNRDLWIATSAHELRTAGLRFVDMLLARQNEDGSIPLGYGEQSATYNVADGGQMALSLGQIAPLLDEARREACWQFCRRFAAWAETFYIDDALAAKLMTETEPAKQAQARAGHYGLGSSRGVRNPLGPSWVLPDILGVQLLLATIDPNPDYRSIADRNVRAYLDAGYPAAGYFHAEAMTWAWRDAADPALRTRIADLLTKTFVPPLLTGKEDEIFELGARGTLRALPMIYCRRYLGDAPELRAALLKYVWTFGAETSERSMRRQAEAHPKPHHGESIAASKYAAFSAIWAVELLEPEASFLRMNATGGRPK